MKICMFFFFFFGINPNLDKSLQWETIRQQIRLAIWRSYGLYSIWPLPEVEIEVDRENRRRRSARILYCGDLFSTLPTDIKVMRESIEESLLVTSERRGRRNAEISLMENRAGVESLYKRLRTEGKYPYLPSLSAFRDLPVISMIQTTERTKATSSVADVLQTNPVMADLLKNQLTKWAEKAKQDLGAVLGFPKNWKNASKNVLHPVERVTGRFVCTRCKRVDVKYRSDGCLDFAGACRHECGVGNEKKGRIRKGKKAKWDSSIFVKDEKVHLFL